MGIDLTIVGSPSSIYELADYLDHSLESATNDTHKRLQKLSRESDSFWHGRTGDAFRETVDAVAKAIDPVDEYAKKVADVFRAYARRLERGKARFRDLADEAEAGNLGVYENEVILLKRPIPQMNPVGQAPGIQTAAGNACVADPGTPGWWEKSAELYDRILDEVVKWWSELNAWIDEHIVPLISDVKKLSLLEEAMTILTSGTQFVIGTWLDTTGRRWQTELESTEKHARETKSKYKAQMKALEASKKLRRNSSFTRSTDNLHTRADALDQRIGSLQRGTRILSHGGPVLDVLYTSIEIASGGSPSSALVNAGGGVAASAVGGGGLALASAAGIAVPPVWAFLAIYGLVTIGAEGATWAWESNVPLDVREAIDAGDTDYLFDR